MSKRINWLDRLRQHAEDAPFDCESSTDNRPVMLADWIAEHVTRAQNRRLDGLAREHPCRWFKRGIDALAWNDRVNRWEDKALALLRRYEAQLRRQQREGKG